MSSSSNTMSSRYSRPMQFIVTGLLLLVVAQGMILSAVDFLPLGYRHRWRWLQPTDSFSDCVMNAFKRVRIKIIVTLNLRIASRAQTAKTIAINTIR